MLDSKLQTEKILERLNIKALNDMQVATSIADKKDGDVILLSPTGSGKTLAFLLPVLRRIDPNSTAIQALIIAPSRELALQIESVLKNMGTGYKVNCCYGGHPMRIEKKSLMHPPTILIGTPGRIGDHIQRENVDVSQVKTLVLDEFDKTLEFGFHKEMIFIMESLISVNRKMLTSATAAIEVPDFVVLEKPQTLNFISESGKPKGLSIKQVISPERDKLGTLYKMICQLGDASMLIFCNHRDSVERVSDFLRTKDIVQNYFHGGLEQLDRERILTKFRNESLKILVTTDLAARGLDIPEIKYVIHYHTPTREDPFIHRNGRTARMDAKGRAFMIMHPEEPMPSYIRTPPGVFELKENVPPPEKPTWRTLYIGKGKKDKVNKIDVVGFLSKKGKLEKGDIGLIEVRDFFCYVAVNRKKIHETIRLVGNQKIKGKKARIEIAK